MNKSALIIFIKNPILGKVKTRLAATIGDEKALLIFNILLKHTFKITKELEVDKYLYYSDFIEVDDIWLNDIYQKRLQCQSLDLGERMFSAFMETKELGYENVIIIGSDVLDNSFEILQNAFVILNKSETIIGKAVDGGYYSLGFNFRNNLNSNFLQKIFLGKTWSHENVAALAIEVINSFSLTCEYLPVLRDIDSEKDLIFFPDLYNIL